MLEGPGTFLAIVFAVALAAELVITAQAGSVPRPLGWLLVAIWTFFILQFLLGIAIAPDRVRYLRRNWLTAISLVVPFFRAVRVLRVFGSLRAINGVRALAGFNRAARTLQSVLAWTRAGYAVALAATAVLLGSAAVLMFEAEGTRLADHRLRRGPLVDGGHDHHGRCRQRAGDAGRTPGRARGDARRPCAARVRGGRARRCPVRPSS